jgi:hypothetical protein
MNGPVLYENIIHKSITDNFSLNKVLFCNLCCRNAYSCLFSDGRGTISYYVHICLSYCVKRRGNFVKLLYLSITNPHDWGIRLFSEKLSVIDLWIMFSYRTGPFLVVFFSATIDGRNLIFGHELYIGTPYRGSGEEHLWPSCLSNVLLQK